MKLSGIRLAWVGLSVLVVAVAAAPKEGEKGVGAFASLEKNQSVTVKEVAGRYEIVVVPGVEDGHRIVEIGQDSIVLLDPSGVTETRIPIYSIKAITVTRLPKK
jgi:hypothetical protein